MKDICVGIDFGTTKTLVSFYDETDKRPQTMRLGDGRDYVPTSVYIDQYGEFRFGDYADQLEFDPRGRYSREIKMRLGSEDVVLYTRKKRYSARELATRYLRYIRERCEKYRGASYAQSGEDFRVNRAVITQPVSATPAQEKELLQAAKDAGFAEVELITEPEAAGYAYCSRFSEREFKNALIVDWGGGTLDMALVSIEGDRIVTRPRYTSGRRKGGEVFDQALLNHVIERLEQCGKKEQLSRDMISSAHWSIESKKRIRHAKEHLSESDTDEVMLPSSVGEPYPPVPLRRSEFENLIRSELEEAAQMANELIENIRREDPKLEPTKLLLVGGSSRIPAVADFLKKKTGLDSVSWDWGREAVSLGAACKAAEQWRFSRSVESYSSISDKVTVPDSDMPQKMPQPPLAAPDKYPDKQHLVRRDESEPTESVEIESEWIPDTPKGLEPVRTAVPPPSTDPRVLEQQKKMREALERSRPERMPTPTPEKKSSKGIRVGRKLKLPKEPAHRKARKQKSPVQTFMLGCLLGLALLAMFFLIWGVFIK